jgi:SAM-dependent methyltransferase
MSNLRWELSSKYIVGKGLELGGLHNPLKVVYNTCVTYVDNIDTKTALTIHFPELNKTKIVSVDVLDDGEKLSVFPLESQDFIIASHFLEHLQNPIKAIKNHLSRLKLGGILYYIIPDKRKTFDIERNITSFEHILKDYKKGPQTSYESHMCEWVDLVKHIPKKEQKTEMQRLMAMNFAIHFHVWDMDSFYDFLNKTNDFLDKPFTICEYVNNNTENIAILQKVKSDNYYHDPYSKLEIPIPIRQLFKVYDERKDLQNAFPNIHDSNEGLNNLICWAKKFGIYEENILTPYTSYFNLICID